MAKGCHIDRCPFGHVHVHDECAARGSRVQLHSHLQHCHPVIEIGVKVMDLCLAPFDVVKDQLIFVMYVCI